MEYVGIALAVADFCFIITLVFTMGWVKKTCKAELEKQNDVMAGWMSGTTMKLTELERRIGCVEEDLEKIPVEEVNAEKERLERFNDGIYNIMNFGPDVPKLNKEALRK